MQENAPHSVAYPDSPNSSILKGILDGHSGVTESSGVINSSLGASGEIRDATSLYNT